MAAAKFMDCQAKWFELCGVPVQSRRVVLPDLGITAGLLEAGQGEPLLLLHGGGGLADDWAPLAAQLQDQFPCSWSISPAMGSPTPSISAVSTSRSTPSGSSQP